MLGVLNLVLGLAALAGVVWDISAGQVGTMDGNFIVAVCLFLAALFLGSFFSSARSGDLRAVFVRKKQK